MHKNELQGRISEFVDFLENKERAVNTVKKYERVINSFVSSLPNDKEIEKRDIIKWKEGLLESNFMPTTINDYIIIVNKYLNWMEYGENPQKMRSSLAVNQIRTQKNFTVNNVVSNSDVDRMIKAAYKLGYKDMAMIIQVLFYTGIRINELSKFTVENLKGKTSIRINSKGKIRQITLPVNLNKKLNRYMLENGIDSGYLFTAPKNPNKPLSRSTIDERLKKLASVAKISKKKAHAHSLRHRFTINLSEDGYATETIADVLGHSSSETTRRYLRKSDDEMQQIMNDNESKNRRRR